VAPAHRQQLALARQQQEHLVFQQLVAVHHDPRRAPKYRHKKTAFK
jgi:hypothetical protein